MSPMYTMWVVDGGLINTRPNIVSFVGRLLLPKAIIVNVRDKKPD